MKVSHPKYILKSNDTLQKITELFGVEEDVWKRYHNNMCRLDDVIKDRLPKHLEEIFLLPQLWDKADILNSQIAEKRLEQTNRQIKFGYNKTLPLKFFYERINYGVMLSLFCDDKTNTIKYNVNIQCIERDENEFIIELNRFSEIYINDKEPDLMADELASKVSATLFPIELVINKQNKIIGINNFEEIQDRWNNTKMNIRSYYSGDCLEKYLRLNDKTINNKDVLLRCLRNDWFLFGYFNKLYQTYGSEYSLTHKIEVPFIFDSKGVEYTVNQKIDKYANEQGLIVVEMDGVLTDQRSISDLKNGVDSPYNDIGQKEKGKYWGKYFIESQHHTIDSFILNVELENLKKKISIIVSKIEN